VIREYAVDPDVICSDLNIFQRFLSDFGSDKGRVIGAIPGQWYKEFERRVQKLGLRTIAKRKCFDDLGKLNTTSLVARDRKPLGDTAWLDKATSLNEEEVFNGILTSAVSINENQYDYFNMLECCPDNWEIEQTQSVERKAAELACAIERSLYLASKPVLFIDPYFNPLDDDYRLPFMEFVNRLTSGRFNVKKVYLHTCEQNYDDLAKRKNRGDLERGMFENIKPLLPEGFIVELWIWPNKDIHDRFVLTNHVGYSFGHGLSEVQYQDAINVNINRLGETSRAGEHRKFSRSAGRLGDAITVDGV